jgi:hypothetical protein
VRDFKSKKKIIVSHDSRRTIAALARAIGALRAGPPNIASRAIDPAEVARRLVDSGQLGADFTLAALRGALEQLGEAHPALFLTAEEVRDANQFRYRPFRHRRRIKRNATT